MFTVKEFTDVVERNNYLCKRDNNVLNFALNFEKFTVKIYHQGTRPTFKARVTGVILIVQGKEQRIESPKVFAQFLEEHCEPQPPRHFDWT